MEAEDAAKALRAFNAARQRAIAGGVKKALTATAVVAREKFTERGIGRRVFGAKRTGLARQVYASTVRQEGDAFTGNVAARGLAALQEQGGKTKAHEIVSKGGGGKVLLLHLNGAIGFAKKVNHPGARMPAIPFLAPSIAETEPAFPGYIDEAIAKAVIEVGLA